jgi:hypothetical protein
MNSCDLTRTEYSPGISYKNIQFFCGVKVLAYIKKLSNLLRRIQGNCDKKQSQ